MAREQCQREPWCVKAPGHPAGCRETYEETIARVNAQAARNHRFVGTGRYCVARISFSPMGDALATGVITGWHSCGYPRQHHLDENGYVRGD